MLNQKVKIVYSLKIHLELQRQGFSYITEMKNPNNPKLNCWVYNCTDRFQQAFDKALQEMDCYGRT